MKTANKIINVTKVAREICEDLRRNGFGGIRFHKAEVEEKGEHEGYEDELTKTQHDNWLANCVWFITEPDFPIEKEEEFVDTGGYIRKSVEINYSQFYADLKIMVQKAMGKDVKCTFRPGCFEWECTRNSYKHPV